MDFFKSAMKTAQDMKKSVLEVTKEIQVAKQRGRSKSPDGKVQKVNMNNMEAMEEGVTGFGVFRETKTNIFHVILMESQESVYRTGSIEEAKTTVQQLNNHSSILKAAVISGRLEDFCNQIRSHNDWADIHLASYLNFEDYIINECRKRDPIVVLNRATALDGRFPLQLAAEKRHVALVVKMLKLGADMRKCDISGRNALHYAAMHDSAMLKSLKKHSAEHFNVALQQRDKRLFTPLHYALQTNHHDTIDFLIDSGAKLTAEHGLVAGLSALGLDAILARNPKVVSPDNSSNIFHQKVERKYLKVAQKRNPRMLSQKNERSRTPAHNSVLRNDLDGLIMLVAYGADIAESDEDGNTPLHLAVLQQNLAMVKFLIAMDGGVNERNKEEKTAADMCGAVECAKIFQVYNHSLRQSTQDSGKDVPFIIRTAQRASVLYQSRPESRDKGLRILSLDGGGIRGIALVMTLIHIDKQIANGDITDYIDWIAGTSTGAILALALASGTSLRDCLNLYLRLKDEVFIGSRPHDVAPLEACLKEKFGIKTMADVNPKMKVMVTTTKADIHPPELILLRNYELPETQIKTVKPKDIQVWKAARCSSAAPTYFASFDNTYLDGGLMANNPSLDLLNDVHIHNINKQLEEQDPDPISLLISLGTGKCKPKPMSAIDLELPKSFSWTSVVSSAYSSVNTIKNLKNIFVEQLAASDGQVVERSRGWCHSIKTPFFRFTPTLPVEVPLNTYDNIEIIDLMWQTKLYCISRPEQEIDEIISLLRATEK